MDCNTRLDELKSTLETCRAQETSIINEVLAHVDRLRDELADVESKLQEKDDALKHRAFELEKARGEVNSMNLDKGRLAFAAMLIDGDCMMFKDDLVKEGAQGGRQTAALLKQAALEELHAASSPGSVRAHAHIVVRVYANVQGLAKVYRDSEILADPATLHEFIRGFNMVDPLCDFVDAGNGKECSDEKLRGMFRLSVDDVHCQRIIFGGSADNGYARLLGQYAEDEAVCGRITLLEGPPFAQELEDIKRRFRVAHLDAVFRREKLVTFKRRVSFHATPPATPTADYATVAANAKAVVPLGPSSPIPGPSSSSSGGGANGILGPVTRNHLGRRVDEPVDYTMEDMVWVRGRKLCNQFHLLGQCSFEQRWGKCTYVHGKRLSHGKLQALRIVARLSSCPRDSDCADPTCFLGHRSASL